jgi:hypothetical protein
MTHSEMLDLTAQLVANLEPEQTAEFAGILKDAIINGNNLADLQLIDELLLSVGIDVNAGCRKHPPAPHV